MGLILDVEFLMSFGFVDLSIVGLLSCNLLSYIFERAAHFQQSAWASWLNIIGYDQEEVSSINGCSCSMRPCTYLKSWFMLNLPGTIMTLC